MNRFHAAGFTLAELLLVIAISSIILGLGLPGFQALMQKSRAIATVNWLVGSIAFSRYSAIATNTMVTLCPSENGAACGGEWHTGTIVFTDHNIDRKINGDDRLLARFLPPAQGGIIRWRSFRNRKYLQLTPTGMTNFQNGNIVYCSADRNPLYSRQIIINASGRVRIGHYRDKQGVPVDRNGKPIRC